MSGTIIRKMGKDLHGPSACKLLLSAALVRKRNNICRLAPRLKARVSSCAKRRFSCEAMSAVASNDGECLAHYCGFSQCFFVGLLEGFKCSLREARGGKRRPWLSNSPIDSRPIAWFRAYSSARVRWTLIGSEKKIYPRLRPSIYGVYAG